MPLTSRSGAATKPAHVAAMTPRISMAPTAADRPALSRTPSIASNVKVMTISVVNAGAGNPMSLER